MMNELEEEIPSKGDSKRGKGRGPVWLGLRKRKRMRGDEAGELGTIQIVQDSVRHRKSQKVCSTYDGKSWRLLRDAT